MTDTTARGNGMIVDEGTAGTGTAGTGTLTPPGPPARPARVPRQGRSRADREGARPAPARVPRQAAQSRTQAARTQAARPRTASPQVRRPQTAPPQPKQPQAQPKPKQPQAASRLRVVSPAAASNRMPFIVLLCGLLGGALASALVINTTLAEGSFEISKLHQSDSTLARQRQQLADQVARAQSAPVIQQRAYQLGMRQSGQLQFVNLKTGKVESDAGSGGTAGPNGSAGHAP